MIDCQRYRAAVLLVLAAALGLPASAPAQTDCTIPGQNLFVRNTMQDIYLWYRELPDPNTALFDSPEAYLDAIRFRPLDDGFSYITTEEATDAFFSESQFIGFGMGLKFESQEMRITEVFPGSPAFAAGLRRGYRIDAINGVTVADLIASGEVGGAFGPTEVGVAATIRFRDRGGAEGEVRMTKQVVTIPTVSDTRVFDVDGRKVGYLVFRNFVKPSVRALAAAFVQLRREGAKELVLDLRYNGGGLISVSQMLGGLVGGDDTAEETFVRFVHNDKNSHRDLTLLFPALAYALDLQRVVVITTGASASASELVINSLRPFMPVTVVGDTTYGKPVGQYGYRFCGKVLFPVSFTSRNARNEGDFFGGIPADCPAADDLEHDLGDGNEASLSESLSFVATGECGGAAAASSARARAAAAPRRGVTRDGWRQLVGAY
jgi:C-terminal processing protease CtpA/Prc